MEYVSDFYLELRQMDRVQPPLEKLECIVRCHEIIVGM
jgi:hypothetical protein